MARLSGMTVTSSRLLACTQRRTSAKPGWSRVTNTGTFSLLRWIPGAPGAFSLLPNGTGQYGSCTSIAPDAGIVKPAGPQLVHAAGAGTCRACTCLIAAISPMPLAFSLTKAEFSTEDHVDCPGRTSGPAEGIAKARQGFTIGGT